ncbi:MAG: 50S ribosomal protein L11 methyltransferase [Anaerolineae bacterium]
MDFLEIAVTGIDGEAAETVSELFNRYGYGGAVIEAIAPDFERVTVRTVIPHDDLDRRRDIEVMLALIGKALPHGLPEPRFTQVGENDWATSWREHFHVVRIGRRFVIKPGWREYSPTGNDIVIEIDPGLAFGSGLHPTTQLCLKIFEEMDDDSRAVELLPLAGQEIFDVGAGSGILTIAAMKLGAGRARAVDIDDVAVRVADENFALNGVAGQVESAIGSAADTGGRQWPLVVANILAHILINLMPYLAAAVAPGGQLILSGMIDSQEADVRAAAEAHGLRVIARRQEEDWVALITQK